MGKGKGNGTIKKNTLDKNLLDLIYYIGIKCIILFKMGF